MTTDRISGEVTYSPAEQADIDKVKAETRWLHAQAALAEVQAQPAKTFADKSFEEMADDAKRVLTHHEKQKAWHDAKPKETLCRASAITTGWLTLALTKREQTSMNKAQQIQEAFASMTKELKVSLGSMVVLAVIGEIITALKLTDDSTPIK